ncbi:hypothetical protein BCR33DRAFT_712610 [Rhizoclosmatium globosum]|uniref:Phosphatidylglycerol/phosphatidylinositol transfer protein n=1 Tax=Rhizoclosmatium globosum TaxID=329046 RepID=A0A1Y2CXF6_9FUNG|nr:hypothetical protein BCR33DRAFT_712610 [Rhizoclosmatium globosum]|eukprot:ORY51576.1 hypothetical protein BCR33DRAFT_712610 [Rhizoclosmatium globosum]
MFGTILTATLAIAATASSRPVYRDNYFEERGLNVKANNTFFFCGGTAHIKSIYVSPYNPPNPINIQLTGTNFDTAWLGGTVEFNYTLKDTSGLAVEGSDKSITVDICKSGVTCPVSRGNFVVNFNIPPPTAQRSQTGLLSAVNIQFTDSYGYQKFCIYNPVYAL